jgi:3,4-dihydroxy 2-butanone 4-phosphate synthase / GTP cyclohydrolase II
MRHVGRAGPVTVMSARTLDRAQPRRRRQESPLWAPFLPRAADARTNGVGKAIGEITSGKAVILLGDSEQAGEADLVFAAALSTTALMAACVRLTSGLVGVALSSDRCDQLRLPPQHWSQFGERRPQCVAVDAVGVGTGISAADRSQTARLLANPGAKVEQLTRPGHVIPLRAGVGSDYVDAAVRLAVLAGLPGAAVVSRLVSEEAPTGMAQGPEIYRIASRHQLCTVTVAEILDRPASSSPRQLAPASA